MTHTALVLATGTLAFLAFAGGCASKASTTSSTSSVATTTATTSSGPGGSAAGGAGGAGGIGTPSDVYPASHATVPQVVDAGGNVLAMPVVVPIVFQNDDAAMVASIGELTSALAGSAYWTTTTAEYGVGPLTADPVATIAETPLTSLTTSDVEAWLLTKLDADDPALPTPGPGTIYEIFYPSGTTITEPGAGAGCVAFGGYHTNVVLDAAHGSKPVAYAVIPRCAMFAGLDALDTLTVTTTHETIEAATDPFPLDTPAFDDVDAAHHAWVDVYGGGEVADMCNLPDDQAVTLPGTTFRVQRAWSNAAALAGHDPCVPVDPARVYFNATSDAPDNVKLAGGVAGKGISIPLGGTRTVDVHLFSEGPKAPFKVIPEDLSKAIGGTQQLELSFDEDTGQNGQTLHLTIHVIGTASEQLFRLDAYDGKNWNYWVGDVGR